MDYFRADTINSSSSHSQNQLTFSSRNMRTTGIDQNTSSSDRINKPNIMSRSSSSSSTSSSSHNQQQQNQQSKNISNLSRAIILFILGSICSFVLNILQMEYKSNLFPHNALIFFQTNWWTLPLCGLAAGNN